MRPRADRGQAAGEARKQEAGGLDRDIVQVEKIFAARPSRGLSGEHRIGGEKRREHDDVAEQEDPEAVADDDALRGRIRVIESRSRRPTMAPPRAGRRRSPRLPERPS